MANADPITTTTEQWRPVVGWEGRYEVSDHGRVRSLPREYYYSPVRTRKSKGKILKPGTVRGKHAFVNLMTSTPDSPGSPRKCRYVHQLVMEAFVGPRPEGMEVCHWNDDGLDNRLENLRYGTATDNRIDRIRNGRDHKVNKTHCLRGHEFNELNTRPNGKNGRACLACNRARAYARRHNMKDKMQELSDSYYGQIMSG